jgi:ABC-type branched-subunit amino acid transport system substrate-binding protein
MEPLRAGDPSRLGRYRLLRRLGVGGMGVVFLARAPGGAIAAVKTVRAGYAEEAGFRARFRREAQAARQVRSPWVVPLLDADADAETPWLATSYVPGPSLSETVAVFGPLSVASVRVLGIRLAEALEAVHAAGLVHRDVKPGNVLLAPDGPRLIDFGIARAPEATALTSSGVIVGSPGFLSPEQARARGGEIGPPSDVFSLACVLAFAATGVRPFGDGGAAGVLLRTVYEEPDPAAFPDALAPLLTSCLVKDPAARPALARLRAELEAGVDSGPGGTAGWLPEPVTRLINDRSAAVLALDAVEPTQVSANAGTASAAADTPSGSAATVSGAADTVSPDGATMTAVTATRPAPVVAPALRRRSFLRLGSTAGVLAAGGGGAWWWSTRRGTPSTPPVTIARPELLVAFQGDLTGPAKDSGTAQLSGARLAVEQVNAQSGRPLRLKLVPYDDGGDPARAARLADRLVKDAGVLAVLGPTSDACFLRTETAYTLAAMPEVTVSVDVSLDGRAIGLSQFRSHASLHVERTLLAAPWVSYLSKHVDARNIVLVDDRAQGDTGWKLCDLAQQALRNSGRKVTLTSVPAGRIDYRALAASVVSARADAVACTGDAVRTAGLASALKAAGFTGTRMATEQAFGPGFLTAAGAAATGWVFATSFVDPTVRPAARAFAAAYRARFGAAPGWYAAEAYDAVMFLAAVCANDGTVLRERGAIARHLREVEHLGVTRTVQYRTDHGYNDDAMFLYEVTAGAFHYLGQYKEAAVS